MQYFCVSLHHTHRKYVQFQWESWLYEFLLPMFWLGTGSQNHCKTAEFRSSYFEANEYQDYYLLKRHGSDWRWPVTLIFLLQSFLINLKKSVLSPVQKFGTPKPRIRISTNDSNLTGNKSKEIDFKVLNLSCQPQGNTFGCNQSDKFLCLKPKY